jgi:hypothetical protein
MFVKRCGLAVLVVVIACSSNPSPSTEPESANVATARKSDVITAEELADPSVNMGDALEAVRRLRPGFLMSRGATSMKNASAGSVHVSIDGAPLMTLDNLSRVRPNQIAEIRYLSAPDAAQRFGTTAGSGGVILVKLK